MPLKQRHTLSVTVVPPFAIHEVPIFVTGAEVLPLAVMLRILSEEPALHLLEVGFRVEWWGLTFRILAPSLGEGRVPTFVVLQCSLVAVKPFPVLAIHQCTRVVFPCFTMPVYRFQDLTGFYRLFVQPLCVQCHCGF